VKDDVGRIGQQCSIEYCGHPFTVAAFSAPQSSMMSPANGLMSGDVERIGHRRRTGCVSWMGDCRF